MIENFKTNDIHTVIRVYKTYIILYYIGLDAAGPGFETLDGKVPHLNIDDAKFVDCIHTAGGTFGYSKSLGHCDFYPNEGIAPQPGCGSIKKLATLAYSKYSINLK